MHSRHIGAFTRSCADAALDSTPQPGGAPGVRRACPAFHEQHRAERHAVLDRDWRPSPAGPAPACEVPADGSHSAGYTPGPNGFFFVRALTDRPMTVSTEPIRIR